MIKQICQYCGKEFQVYPYVLTKGFGKFCSMRCFHKTQRKGLKTKRTCQQCGKEFFVSPSAIGKFCCEKCHYKFKTESSVKFCLTCGGKFYGRSKGKFCSKECFIKSITKRIKIICKMCGKEFEGIPSRKFCSYQCYWEYSWKDYKQSAYYNKLHKWIRRNKPLPNACEICGKVTIKLEAANISSKYQRDLNDFIYLCKKCHIIFDKTKKNNPNSCPKEIIKQMRKQNGTYASK